MLYLKLFRRVESDEPSHESDVTYDDGCVIIGPIDCVNGVGTDELVLFDAGTAMAHITCDARLSEFKFGGLRFRDYTIAADPLPGIKDRFTVEEAGKIPKDGPPIKLRFDDEPVVTDGGKRFLPETYRDEDHPEHKFEDWRLKVMDGTTRLGYGEWVLERVASADIARLTGNTD